VRASGAKSATCWRLPYLELKHRGVPWRYAASARRLTVVKKVCECVLVRVFERVRGAMLLMSKSAVAVGGTGYCTFACFARRPPFAPLPHVTYA